MNMPTFIKFFDCWNGMRTVVTWDDNNVWSSLRHVEFNLSDRVDDDDIYEYRQAKPWEIEEYGIWKNGTHYDTEDEAMNR